MKESFLVTESDAVLVLSIMESVTTSTAAVELLLLAATSFSTLTSLYFLDAFQLFVLHAYQHLWMHTVSAGKLQSTIWEVWWVFPFTSYMTQCVEHSQQWYHWSSKQILVIVRFSFTTHEAPTCWFTGTVVYMIPSNTALQVKSKHSQFHKFNTCTCEMT